MSTPQIEETVFSQFPILTVRDHIVLRDPRLSDGPAYLEYVGHPEVAQYIPDSCLPKTIKQAEAEIQWSRDLYNRRNSVAWAIVDTRSNEMIGTIGYEHWVRFHRRAEIAYDLNPKYWRQGIMSDCVAQVFKYSFDVMEINRVDAFTTIYNQPSIKILEKIGFVQDGVLREFRWFKGKYIDVLLFGYTRNDYKKEHSLISRILSKIND